MSGRRQTSRTTLKRTRTAANYSLPSISAVPGKVVEQIFPAITTKNLKNKKRTASRDLERTHRDKTTVCVDKVCIRDKGDIAQCWVLS